MNGSAQGRIVIAGVSSYLGRRFADMVLQLGGWEIGGLYNTPSAAVEHLMERCVPRGSKKNELFQRCDFARHLDAYPGLDSFIPSSGTSLTFIYMCGAWHTGAVTGHRNEDISRVLSIGLQAPIYCCSQVFRLRVGAAAPTRCIIVTGLGGERAGVRYSSLYGSIVGGIYNFVRAVGMEVAGTNMSCVGLALGLFDKGQPYLQALCEQLVTCRPTPIEDVLDTLATLSLSYRSGLNGSVVEVAGGLQNYQNVAEILYAQRQG